MSLELGRRLLASAAVGVDELHAALVVHLRSGGPLASVLLERGIVSAELLEQELARSGKPALEVVVPSRELFNTLPRGLCRALLAVPIREDPHASFVEVATVDPADGHVRQEFAFHLGKSVRLLRAGAIAIAVAIDRLEGLDALGTSAMPRTGKTLTEIPAPPFANPKPYLETIATATERDAVIRNLVAALSTVARRVGVFIVRGEGFRGLACNPSFANEADFRNIVVGGDRSNLLAQAVREGTYVGKLPDTTSHRGLRELLGAGDGAVLVHPIHVAGRPTLVLVANQMGDVSVASRLANDLEFVAGDALARILATRKAPRT